MQINKNKILDLHLVVQLFPKVFQEQQGNREIKHKCRPFRPRLKHLEGPSRRLMRLAS